MSKSSIKNESIKLYQCLLYTVTYQRYQTVQVSNASINIHGYQIIKLSDVVKKTSYQAFEKE